jgi:hypothetical protein
MEGRLSTMQQAETALLAYPQYRKARDAIRAVTHPIEAAHSSIATAGS